MIEENIIRLRGHHLDSLEQYIHERKFLRKLWNLINDPSIILDFGLRNGLALHPNYGKKHIVNSKRIYELIIKKRVDIEITNSLDDICLPYCDMREDSCKNKEKEKEDKKIAERYGLRIGNVYRANEIIESALNYFKK